MIGPKHEKTNDIRITMLIHFVNKPNFEFVLTNELCDTHYKIFLSILNSNLEHKVNTEDLIFYREPLTGKLAIEGNPLDAFPAHMGLTANIAASMPSSLSNLLQVSSQGTHYFQDDQEQHDCSVFTVSNDRITLHHTVATGYPVESHQTQLLLTFFRREDSSNLDPSPASSNSKIAVTIYLHDKDTTLIPRTLENVSLPLGRSIDYEKLPLDLDAILWLTRSSIETTSRNLGDLDQLGFLNRTNHWTLAYQ